jgi:hypothetical protein
MNEFRRLNPNAAYAPPPPPPAPNLIPGVGAVAAVPPPMSEHPDAVYEENALAPAAPAPPPAAPSNAGSQGGGGGGSAAMSIVPPTAPPSVHTEPEAEAMDIDNEVPVPGAVPNIPQAPQDPLHVGGNPANPIAQGQIPEAQNYIDLGDADEPLLDQLFPNMVDGATATETSSEASTATTATRACV